MAVCTFLLIFLEICCDFSNERKYVFIVVVIVYVSAYCQIECKEMSALQQITIFEDIACVN